MGAPQGPAAPGSVCPAASKRADIRSAPPCPIHHPPGSTAPLRGAGKEVPRLLGSPRRMCPPHPVPGTSVTGVGRWGESHLCLGLSVWSGETCLTFLGASLLTSSKRCPAWQRLEMIRIRVRTRAVVGDIETLRMTRGEVWLRSQPRPPFPVFPGKPPAPPRAPVSPLLPRPHLPGVPLQKGLLGWGLAGWAGQGTPSGTADLGQAPEGRLGLWPFPREQNRPVLPPLSVHSTALGSLPRVDPRPAIPESSFQPESKCLQRARQGQGRPVSPRVTEAEIRAQGFPGTPTPTWSEQHWKSF